MIVKALEANPTFSGDIELRITVDKSNREHVQELMSDAHTLDVVIARQKQKRTTDANAYAWVLMGKLADKLGISAEEIYREYVTNIGGNFTVVPVKDEAVETWVQNWEHAPKTKIGWVSKILGKAKTEGYTNTVNYYGSSTYDTRQMSRLIDLIIADCKSQGIETMTPDEIARLKANWRV